MRCKHGLDRDLVECEECNKDKTINPDDYYGKGYNAGEDHFERVHSVPWFWIWLAVFLAFCTWCVHAQVTLSYTGQPIGANILTGTVVLTEPLQANGTQLVTPASFLISGDVRLSMANGQLSPDGTPSFSFTTVNGVITAWDIELSVFAGNGVADISVTNLGDSYALNYIIPSCLAGITEFCVPPVLESNTTPGTWTVPQAAMAEMNARLATSQIDVRNLSNGYMAAQDTLKTEGACILKLRRGGKC